MKKLLACLIASALLFAGGSVLAASTTTKVYGKNKTDRRIVLVVTDKNDSSVQEAVAIPAQHTRGVSIEAKAFFRESVSHAYTAMLYYTDAAEAVCTVVFTVINRFETESKISDLKVDSTTGNCTVNTKIEEYHHNQNCQISIKASPVSIPLHR
jgi:hypothetical protein